MIKLLKLKLLRMIRKESLARARRRINLSLRQSAQDLVFRNVLRDGTEGYSRETYVYGGAK